MRVRGENGRPEKGPSFRAMRAHENNDVRTGRRVSDVAAFSASSTCSN